MKKLSVVLVMPTAIALTLWIRCLTPAQQLRGSVTGSVVYPDGKPAPGFRVFRYRSDNPTGLQGGTISQSDGSFTLNHLEPGVSYDLCASKPEDGYLNPLFLPFGLPVGGQCRSVMLRVGVNPDKVQLQLSKKAGALAGRLIDARTRRPVTGKLTLYRPLKLDQGRWILVDSKQATWIPSIEQEPMQPGDSIFLICRKALFSSGPRQQDIGIGFLGINPQNPPHKHFE